MGMDINGRKRLLAFGTVCRPLLSDTDIGRDSPQNPPHGSPLSRQARKVDGEVPVLPLLDLRLLKTPPGLKVSRKLFTQEESARAFTWPVDESISEDA
jgi:hypothetical protein